MKKLLLILLVLVAITSCKKRNYKESIEVPESNKIEVPESNAVEDIYNVKVLSNSSVYGIGQISVIEVNGEYFLVSSNGGFQELHF